MKPLLARYFRIALSLAGSAILLYSCEQYEEDAASADEAMMTEYSENLTVLMSQNGRRSYHFTTPLLEGYSMAMEPYREFRKGVKITTYKDDSLSTVDAVLTANYAIYYENRQLWEAKGNVVVEKSDGKTLYTQQLFWNQRTGKIYSNVDSKIVQSGGRDVFVGEGFESDEEFSDWRFRRMTGRMEVEVAPNERPDSLAADSAAPSEAASGEGAAAERTPSRQPEERGPRPDPGPSHDGKRDVPRRRSADASRPGAEPDARRRPLVQRRPLPEQSPTPKPDAKPSDADER